MLNFCTLYNSNYAAKGLAMYESLCRVCPEFHLYVFAFDDILADALKRMALPHVTVVTLAEFEDEELLRVKKTRTAGEYCWTCSSCSIYYCLTHFDIDNCTYIDADLLFFSNPQVLIDEMGDDDVLITEHRYSPQYDESKLSGKYCVQFVTFKKTERGMKVLKWWKDACIDWCYNRYDANRFGDQMYLDDWTTRFEGVHELQHLGGGVAPWNMQQYVFRKQETRTEKRELRVVGTEIATGKEFPLVFFHFHNLICWGYGKQKEFHLMAYTMPKTVRELIYKPYMHAQRVAYDEMHSVDARIDGVATKQARVPVILLYMKHLWKRMMGDNRYFYWL